jgi:L-fucose isomerase-like protein
VERLPRRSILSAVKIYLAVKRDLEQDPSVQAVGINCLNESHFSDTTPCLAWNMLFEEKQILWGCEGDTVSMLTKLLVHRSLGAPVMMTNLYPFLMGQAAVKHERIADFPAVPDEPENHILAAHCGYLGVAPRSFAEEWTLRKKVLAIVDDNATAIDARLPTGEITLVKVEPTFDRISVVEGRLTGYAQFPGSDCVNGAIIKVRDGHRLMDQLSSHHYIVSVGRNLVQIQNVAKIFGLETSVL